MQIDSYTKVSGNTNSLLSNERSKRKVTKKFIRRSTTISSEEMSLTIQVQNDSDIRIDMDSVSLQSSPSFSSTDTSSDSSSNLGSLATVVHRSNIHCEHSTDRPSVAVYYKQAEVSAKEKDEVTIDVKPSTSDSKDVKVEFKPLGPTKSNTCENCGQELNNSSKVKEVDITNSESSVYSLNQQSNVDLCRICHCEGELNSDGLIAPCRCKGSLTYVHHACLQRWIKSSGYKHCELCGFQFAMDSKLKPFNKWEKLAMSTAERRRVGCSVVFHLIAIICVVWSLYVLIERTASELEGGELSWPFWTKLVVVAVGFTGGLVFMYVQCKTYMDLWRRLKAYNRIIYVQHQPESATDTATSAKKKIVPGTSESGTNCSATDELNNRSDQNLNMV